jgi:D-alanyl-D-alanine carboxypeptidase
MRRLLPPLLIVAALLTGAAAASAQPLSDADRAFVDATVAQTMQAGRLPGLSIQITGPKGDYSQAYGVADTATAQPLALDDHVRIASITKTFTATAVLLQVQKGRLALSDTLSEYVKGVPNGRRITIRQLLAMRSGIYDFTADPAFDAAFAANPLMPFGLADVLAIIRRHAPAFAPGAKTSYADSNYFLLGAILEKVTHRSVESVITRDVIRPLGLTHTSFPTTPALPTPFAHGYYAGPDGTGDIRDLTQVGPQVAWTAGAMISTVGDLQRYGRQLAAGALLSPAMQRQRLRFGTIPNQGGPSVGYGLGILRVGDWLGHDGAIFGFSTETFVDPKTGAEIVSAANLSSNSSTPTLDVFAQIAAHLYPASLQ